MVTSANGWILNHFDWLFNYTSLAMVLLCAITFFSPIGKYRIGGKDAVPLLNRWRWFSIILCTTIAVGILFWGAAEPIYHSSSLPGSLTEGTPNEVAGNAMSSVFMHWSFTPYAIYSIPALLFALGYYNKQRSFSLGSMLFPLLQQKKNWWQSVLDSVCLFALVAGMSASLGAGILSLSGGISKLGGPESSPLVLGIIVFAIVASFTISAATGLLKGIRTLSSINISMFILLSAAILFLGPTGEMFSIFASGIGEYFTNFLPHSLGIGDFSDEGWMHNWTSFYWANWMAWAPVTALFLGRIAYGYTVREFLLFNWIVPALFGILWMSIFSGTSLSMDMVDGGLSESLKEHGPESIVYEIFNNLPIPVLLSFFFIATMFISYVTAADSNTEAMSGISAHGVSPKSPEPPIMMKFTWGIIVGVVAWVMVSFSGIDGVKMLSNLGGLPALLFLSILCIGMIVLLVKQKKIFKE